MTNTERKARELIARYGCDMARVRARYLAERGNGVIRCWWEGVLQAIGIPEATGKAN
ncbi:MAG: hypothetical protein JEZ11_00885 [Desulfobacterales bacterium]|nr:hypothetical protein [Desulfobacterales bacterium]